MGPLHNKVFSSGVYLPFNKLFAKKNTCNFFHKSFGTDVFEFWKQSATFEVNFLIDVDVWLIEVGKSHYFSPMKMLSKDQKVILAQMIFNDRDLLFGDCGPNLSKVEKQEKWIEIFIKLNAMGANIPDYKVNVFYV